MVSGPRGQGERDPRPNAMDNYYGLNIFKDKDNYCYFYEFIQKNVIIYEFSDEDELSESDEDINLRNKV